MRADQVYLSSLINFYGSQHFFMASQLKNTQKKINSFVISKSYTKGFQKYLPSKLGGVGCPHIESLIKASKIFFIRKLFSPFESILTVIPKILMKWKIPWNIFIIGSKWKMDILSKLFENN